MALPGGPTNIPLLHYYTNYIFSRCNFYFGGTIHDAYCHYPRYVLLDFCIAIYCGTILLHPY